jgi:type IV secretory pathway ATPase VirB11/archaellum biosynthesis ATPase
MSLVELSPTLVSRLGVLESFLIDPANSEVLISGPNQIWVIRDGRSHKVDVRYDEGAIRSLASRLARTLAVQENRGSRSGLIAPELQVSVVGTPRGQNCPVIRFVRRTVPKRTLSQLAQEGVLGRDVEMRLLQACRGRRSIVICGHSGSGRTDLLAALARVWKEERRVAVLDAGGRIGAADVGHVTLEPSAGVQAALLLGADVIVTDDPPPSLWADLLGSGRPFLATVEAADAKTALARVSAFWLQEKSSASQTAGRAMVDSSITLVVEMERAHGRCTVKAIVEPSRADAPYVPKPVAAPTVEMSAPPRRGVSDLGVVAIPKEPTHSFVVDGFGFETSDISEIRAESLMSASFVGRIPQEPPTPDIPEHSATDPSPKDRSPSERAPTLVGRPEDETHPPADEQTIHAQQNEMTLEPLDVHTFDPTVDPTNNSWSNDAPSEVTHGPSLDDEPDDTENKELYNERTPHGALDEKKKAPLTNEEIEGMLNDLDDVLGSDDGPKAKRRTRKAR